MSDYKGGGREPDEEEGMEKRRASSTRLPADQTAGSGGGRVLPQGLPINPPATARRVERPRGGTRIRHDFPLGAYDVPPNLGTGWGERLAAALRMTDHNGEFRSRGASQTEGDPDTALPPMLNGATPTRKDKGKEKNQESSVATVLLDEGQRSARPEPAWQSSKQLRKQLGARKAAISNIFQHVYRREPEYDELSYWMQKAETLLDDYDRLFELILRSKDITAAEGGESSSSLHPQEVRTLARFPQPNKGIRPPSVTEAEDQRRVEIGEYWTFDSVPPSQVVSKAAETGRKKPKGSKISQRESLKRFNELYTQFPPHPDEEGGGKT